ncbi:uncharacterized protein LOC130725186 [Lotus japonicus]|uniref:uncharacterized protein LOC130725186 n=1 Tax=Lotus japonicus TaxID=34305 RepID=UPI002584AF0E|nr:uncharacterized protein LOC130725186 [Lotus japonicus]
MAGPTGYARASWIHDRSYGESRRFRSSERTRKLEQREGMTLFVDGLDDRVKYKQLRKAFEKYGKVESIFLPRTKKKMRRFRFGFIHFSSRNDGCRAIQGWHRQRLNNVYLTVLPARFPLRQRNDRFTMKRGTSGQYNIKNKVWKPKVKVDKSQGASWTRKSFTRKEWRVKRKRPEKKEWRVKQKPPEQQEPGNAWNQAQVVRPKF